MAALEFLGAYFHRIDHRNCHRFFGNQFSVFQVLQRGNFQLPRAKVWRARGVERKTQKALDDVSYPTLIEFVPFPNRNPKLVSQRAGSFSFQGLAKPRMGAWPGRNCATAAMLVSPPLRSSRGPRCAMPVRRVLVRPPGSHPGLVQPVLNSPVAPYVLQQFPRPGRPPQAGDSVSRLHRHGNFDPPAAALADLPGPVQVFSSQ